jgi:hypothetical protein
LSLHHWPNPQVPWRSFHNHWIIRLVEYLNDGVLPPLFQARPTELIVGIEPDLLLLQTADSSPTIKETDSFPASPTATATLPVPAERPFVGIYSSYDSSRLVAAIELVSPGNKDRPEAVRAFVEKSYLLLQNGVHLLLVDVIGQPQRSMRRPLLERLGLADVAGSSEGLWVASYAALPAEDPQAHLTVREWAEPLAVGQPLPQLPLFLRTDQLWVMVDLDQTYRATLQAGRYRPA